MVAEPAGGSEAGAVTFGAPPEPQRAAARGRASSLTAAPRQRRSATLRAVTQGHVAAVRSGAHVTGRLPSLRMQHARVHEAAAGWEHWLLKYGRLVWGYFHLVLIKTPLNVLEWVTETFPRFAITGLLAFLAWKYH